MHVDIFGIPVHRSENELFIHQIKPLVEEIFNGETENKNIGYIQSSVENFRDRSHQYLCSEEHISPFDERNTQRELIDVKYQNNACIECKDIDSLGPLEKAFINSLYSYNNGVTILTGALGSGKSSLIRHISKYIKTNRVHANCKFQKLCKHHKDFHLFFDFNSSVFDKDTETSFYTELYTKLSNMLLDLLNYTGALDDFMAWIRKKKSEKLRFFEYHIECKFRENEWGEKKEDKKFYEIKLFIEDNYSTYKTRFMALLEILDYYHDEYGTRESMCLMLIFDNIDILDEADQNIIIREINIINHMSRIKIIMTSRLTTFNRIRGNASFSFGVFNNTGIQPLTLILRRIEHYLQNKETHERYKNVRGPIPEDKLKSFDDRLSKIYTELNSQRFQRLKKTLIALSGLSCRRGLRIFRRLFYNHIILWNDTSIKEDLLIRSLYSYDFPKGKMHPEDTRLSNVFLSPYDNNLTLSPLRILGALSYRPNHEVGMTKEMLFNNIKLFNPTNNDDSLQKIIDVLNKTQKRLIYTSGSSASNEVETEIRITFTGQNYLSYLSNDLQYLQSCFEIILWKVEKKLLQKAMDYLRDIKETSAKRVLCDALSVLYNEGAKAYLPERIDYASLINRIQFIRKSLNVVFYQDICETIVFIKATTEKNEDIIPNTMISIPIIVSAGESVKNILSGLSDIPNSREELLDWQSFIDLIREYIELDIFQPIKPIKGAQLLESLSKEIEKRTIS